MKTPAKILVIDDVPRNVKLLADLLTAIRTHLKRRLIASWQPEIEKSEAQSGPGLKQIEHFSPLVNGILLAQKLG